MDGSRFIRFDVGVTFIRGKKSLELLAHILRLASYCTLQIACDDEMASVA